MALIDPSEEPPVVRDQLQKLAAVLYSGPGVPTFTPVGRRALYIRTDGGAGTTLYVWEGAAWVGK